MTAGDRGELMSTLEVAEFLGFTQARLRQWRYEGRGPTPWEVDPANGRCVGYLRGVVEDWLASGRIEPWKSGA